MTGPVWLVVVLRVGVVWALWWLVADWRRDVRQAKTAGRSAQAAIADMGRHSRDEPEERTEPLATLDTAMALVETSLPHEANEPTAQVTVAELVERIGQAGLALRLNWRREDERRAKGGTGGSDAGDFPTAVLPVIQNEEP